MIKLPIINKSVIFSTYFIFGYVVGSITAPIVIFIVLVWQFSQYDTPWGNARSPLFSLYRSYDCLSKDTVDCTLGKFGSGFKLQAGNTLQQILYTNLYFIDKNKDLTDQNRVDLSSWQCKDDKTKKMISLSMVGQMEKIYDCWPKIPLQPNTTITSNGNYSK